MLLPFDKVSFHEGIGKRLRAKRIGEEGDVLTNMLHSQVVGAQSGPAGPVAVVVHELKIL